MTGWPSLSQAFSLQVGHLQASLWTSKSAAAKAYLVQAHGGFNQGGLAPHHIGICSLCLPKSGPVAFLHLATPNHLLMPQTTP